jgi:hypothetical protein
MPQRAFFSRFVFSLATMLGLAGQANAGLILTVENKQLPTNAPGFVDVSIGSNAGDILDSVSYEFVITRLSGPGFLHFASTNSDDLLNNTNYVFNGVSTLIPSTPYGSSSQTSFPNDTFIGGDSTILDVNGDPINAPVHSAGSPQLLTRLQLTPDQVTTLSSFEIDLVPRSGQGSLGDPTSFTTFDSGSLLDTTVAFSSESGVVSFAPFTAVPEPGTIRLALFAAVCLLTHWRWTRHTRC